MPVLPRLLNLRENASDGRGTCLPALLA